MLNIFAITLNFYIVKNLCCNFRINVLKVYFRDEIWFYKKCNVHWTMRKISFPFYFFVCLNYLLKIKKPACLILSCTEFIKCIEIKIF